jgi:hypothetical protein
MTAITLCSWIAVIIILFVYFKGSEQEFAWANMLLCVPVALPALLVGAYPSAFISLTFGAIGAWKVYNGK